jgi:hypothetical protein
MATTFLSNLRLSTHLLKTTTGTSLGLLSGLLHAMYAYGTQQQQIITIKDKYQFDRNGTTNIIIVDQDDVHYRMHNSLWYWKWNSFEDISKNGHVANNLLIKYYGYRVPFLGLFPNIYFSDKMDTKKIE